MTTICRIFLILLLAVATGCATRPGPTAQYEDTSRQGMVSGVGIESQDITSMTDKMVADMLASPILMNKIGNRTPRVIIDSKYFINESSSRIDKKIITDRLRTELNRSAKGKILFVGRQYEAMVDEERERKRTGTDDQGTLGLTKHKAGTDFRLGGRIGSIDAVDTKSGATSRSHHIVFEMVDVEAGFIIWNGIYDFKKAARNDVIYR